MQDIAELCERVILIDHGKLFFDGPLDAVLDRFATNEAARRGIRPRRARRIFARFGRVLEREGARVKLEVPRGQVAEVCRELLACGPVSDFSAQEIPIEEIIRQVFGERKV